MAKSKKDRAILQEAEQDALTDIDLKLPPVDTEIPPVEENPEVPEEVANNAYSDLLQDLLRKEWDVINACDSLIATLSGDEVATFDKEAVAAVLKEISDKVTTTVGMATKALSLIDPTQEELMKDGEKAAEDAINMTDKEVVEENLKEDNQGFAKFNLTFKNKRGKEYQKQDSMLLGARNAINGALDDIRRYFQHYYKDKIIKVEPAGWINEGMQEDYETARNMVSLPPDELFPEEYLSEKYWAYEILWNVENLLGYNDNNDEMWYVYLDNADEETLKAFCLEAADRLINNDYVWGEINETINDIIFELADEKMKDIKDIEYNIGGNPEEDR